MTEFEILSAVKNSGGSIAYIDLLNIGKSDPEWDSLTDRDLIKKLIESNILSGNPEAYGSITFGTDGRLRLKELQQIIDDQSKQAADSAKEKASQRRHDWAVAMAGTVLGAILGIAGTLIVQCILG